MSYKTLILIDNSKEMTTLNQDIIRHTLKYYINHIEDGDKVAVAVTGPNAEYVTQYDDSKSTQLKAIEDMTFTEVNAPSVDALMEVVLDWKDSDVAYRDILFVGFREIASGSDYSEEEFLFEVNGKEYPIYTLACNQNENTSFVKSMKVLSRISGGSCITTEDAKSDAEIEKQLCDMIFSAMQERRIREEEASLETQEVGDEAGTNYDSELQSRSSTDEEDVYDKTLNKDISDDEEYVESTESEMLEEGFTESGTIYQMSKDEDNFSFVMPIAVIAAIIIFFAISLYVKNIKAKKEEQKFLDKLSQNGNDSVKKRMPFDDEIYGGTVYLGDDDLDNDGGTRLLYQTKEGLEITLEDRANPTKYYRIHVRESVTIGRNEKLCDVAINYDDSISSKHCELYAKDGNLYCRDLGSSNGTMINQQKVYQELRVESGDILRIGRLSFFVQIIEG